MMPDREKVAKEKLDEIVDMCRGLSYASFMTAVENANDILALLKEQEEKVKALHIAQNVIADYLQQPEIVRCKDCRKHGDIGCQLWTDAVEWETDDDWFCADGEKR